MTWTEAATAAAQHGFNAYRNSRGELQLLLGDFTSRPGDWKLEDGRIVSPLGPRFMLVMVRPEPQTQKDIDATITLQRPA